MQNNKTKSFFLASLIIAPLISFSNVADAGRRGGGGAPAPDPVIPGWTALLGSTTTDYGNDVAVDSLGNVVVVGDTFGSVNGGTLQGSMDGFVAKYDADGVLLWSNQIGTADFDRYFGVTVDSSDNVYAIGASQGSLAATNLGSNDIILTKHDSAGNLVWMKQFGTTGADLGHSVATDSLGNVYICGETSGSLAASNTSFNSDAYVAKLDTAGTILWEDQFSSSTQLGNGEDCKDIVVDANDETYITGYTPGALVAGASGDEFYVKKYDAAGAVAWLAQRDSVYLNAANSIAVDAAGNSYIAGTGGLDAPISGLEDAFIVKFDATGVEQWAALSQSTGRESFDGIAVDDAGNVFASGFTDGSLAATNAGDTDIIFARYDTNGTQVSLIQNDTASWDRANGVAVNALGTDYYLVGNTDGNLNGVTNNGAYDLFVTRNRP